MKKYEDLADLEEDRRIDKIGQAAMSGQVVAFVTDDEPGKAKLKKKFPALQVTARANGPVAGTVSVQVRIPKG